MPHDSDSGEQVMTAHGTRRVTSTLPQAIASVRGRGTNLQSVCLIRGLIIERAGTNLNRERRL